MSSLCYKCEKEIVDDEYAECDGCDSIFHLKCNGVTKAEAKARQKSKCLRLYCPTCMEEKSNGTAAKIKEMLQLLYKIDCCSQEQKINIADNKDLTLSIKNQLNAMESKVNENALSADMTYAFKRNDMPSYASVASKGCVKPAVVIRPKAKQTCAKTFEVISSKVDKSEVQICGTRNARNGGVVLRCENSTETMKVKQLVDSKLGDDYEVILPKIKLPRLKVCNIDNDLPNDAIINELKKHNPQLNDIDIRLITVVPRKLRSMVFKDIVIEVNSESFKKLLSLKSLNLPWRECKIFEHLHVSRCYKCCGFSHKSNVCKNVQICSRCSGTHKHSDCKNKYLRCVNCKHSNDKFKTNLDTKHHAWDKDCPIYKRRLSNLVNKIEYNQSD